MNKFKFIKSTLVIMFSLLIAFTFFIVANYYKLFDVGLNHFNEHIDGFLLLVLLIQFFASIMLLLSKVKCTKFLVIFNSFCLFFFFYGTFKIEKNSQLYLRNKNNTIAFSKVINQKIKNTVVVEIFQLYNFPFYLDCSIAPKMPLTKKEMAQLLAGKTVITKIPEIEIAQKFVVFNLKLINAKNDKVIINKYVAYSIKHMHTKLITFSPQRDSKKPSTYRLEITLETPIADDKVESIDLIGYYEDYFYTSDIFIWGIILNVILLLIILCSHYSFFKVKNDKNKVYKS